MLRKLNSKGERGEKRGLEGKVVVEFDVIKGKVVVEFDVIKGKVGKMV